MGVYNDLEINAKIKTFYYKTLKHYTSKRETLF